jgi:hypothetical protein
MMLMLTAVKIIHTIIWFLMVSATFFVFYAGLTGLSNLYVWHAVALVLVEGVALAANGWVCPLRKLAVRIQPDLPPRGDLFLPGWLLFRGYTLVVTAAYLIGVTLVVVNSLAA